MPPTAQTVRIGPASTLVAGFRWLLLLLLALPGVAEAKKYKAVQNGKEVVVHTNPAPVAVHRALPPYGLGKHVYAGRRP
jgi:hypothetical protein